MKIGDIVGRKSHNSDILFRVENINDKGIVTLVGIKYRLKVNSTIDDVVQMTNNDLEGYTRDYKDDIDNKINKILSDRYVKNQNLGTIIPGTVLHIDADKYYLDLCMKYYSKLGITAFGELCEEDQQPNVVEDLLKKYNPDILVVTGHDSLKTSQDKTDINNYSNSKYFIETVKRAREVVLSKDMLVIIAGACQSYYEELIKAGANVSSSPKRIVIHALDPLLVAEKIAFTNISDVIQGKEITENTLSGIDGMGALETRGISRELYPNM